jgi:hypothetical protein
MRAIRYVGLMVLSAALLLLSAAPATAATPPRAEPPAKADPLPRITTRDGNFVEKDTGKVFHLRGFNYIRLVGSWHRTFDVNLYDAPRAEAMFADLRANGFNTVRVFIDHQRNGLSPPGAQDFPAQYIDNFVDFCQRARAAGIYVVPAVLELPNLPKYRIPQGEGRGGRGGSGGISGPNAMILTPEGVAAKAAYMADFAAAVKARDPGVMSTILAFEMDNETHFRAAAPFTNRAPFTDGWGQTYDLTKSSEIQRLADDAVIRWANASVASVRAVDPDAIVTINVFTFRAVGRTGPGTFLEDEDRATAAQRRLDRRFPARPLALARSNIGYVDIHFYPFDNRTLDRDLVAIEFEQFKQACQQSGKPMIVGEFGAFKNPYPTISAAAEAMRAHLKRFYDLGFAGYLYWTYDTDEQNYLWNGKSADGEILQALKQVHALAEAR